MSYRIRKWCETFRDSLNHPAPEGSEWSRGARFVLDRVLELCDEQDVSAEKERRVHVKEYPSPMSLDALERIFTRNHR